MKPPAGGLSNCGTDSGYHRHRYRMEPACDACKAAHSKAQSGHAESRRARDAALRETRRASGWCRACIKSSHAACAGCACEVCSVRLAAALHDAVKAPLENPVLLSAGVDGKGEPPDGTTLEEAG